MSPVVPLIVFAVLGAAAGIWWLRRLASRSEQDMRARFPQAKLLLRSVLFFGQESKGKMQLRGNGTLVVTDSEVVFQRWWPKAEYRIRVDDITGIDLPMQFLGKSVGRPLLRIAYRSPTGPADSMAWHVNDPQGIKSQIEDLRS